MSPDESSNLPWIVRSRRRLALVLLVALALPVGTFTAAVEIQAHDTLEAQAVDANGNSARLAAEVVDALFEGFQRFVESQAAREALHGALQAGDADAVRELLHAFVETNPAFDRVFVTSPEGVELYDWPHDPQVIGKSFADRDWYRGVSSRGATYVSEVYRRAAAPRWDIIAVTTPIVGDDGLLGYLVAQYTMHELAQRLADSAPGVDGAITLVDQHGHAAVARERFDEGDTIHPLPDALATRLLSGEQGSFTDADPADGRERFVGYAPVESLGWAVMAAQPVDVVLAPAYALKRAILTMAVPCAALVFVVAFLAFAHVRRHHMAALALQDLKDRLTGMLVHDLRSPLTTTRLTLDMLADDPQLSSDAHEQLRQADGSLQRVLALTDNLVDVMRMEAGALELHRTSIDVAALARRTVDAFRPLAMAGNVDLGASAPSAPYEAEVDGSLVARVLENLVSNAIKHTPPGGRVEVRVAPRPAGECELAVTDTGEGIPPEEIPRLFQRFGRARGQTFRQARDAGLGLVFCRMAVELHGGTIDVRSAPREGSTFRVLLPVR
ncbi:MAG: sensor histidine kinase [Myxococcales bacterium]|nr:sensor histidine kinase [Myxococcales bacterium]MCB9896843.1 sensor histidine kinase [Planctomycetota bacterium]